MTCRPDPRPTFTPIDTGVDWLCWQGVQVLPALTTEINRLIGLRRKLETLLEEKQLDAGQRRELSYVLDLLYKRGIIFQGTGAEKDRDPDGKFIGEVDHDD